MAASSRCTSTMYNVHRQPQVRTSMDNKIIKILWEWFHEVWSVQNEGLYGRDESTKAAKAREKIMQEIHHLYCKWLPIYKIYFIKILELTPKM